MFDFGQGYSFEIRGNTMILFTKEKSIWISMLASTSPTGKFGKRRLRRLFAPRALRIDKIYDIMYNSGRMFKCLSEAHNEKIHHKQTLSERT